MLDMKGNRPKSVNLRTAPYPAFPTDTRPLHGVASRLLIAIDQIFDLGRDRHLLEDGLEQAIGFPIVVRHPEQRLGPVGGVEECRRLAAEFTDTIFAAREQRRVLRRVEQRRQSGAVKRLQPGEDRGVKREGIGIHAGRDLRQGRHRTLGSAVRIGSIGARRGAIDQIRNKTGKKYNICNRLCTGPRIDLRRLRFTSNHPRH